jgi:NodT family efflux transporter outer membrane factor (OMF) lipoprotein
MADTLRSLRTRRTIGATLLLALLTSGGCVPKVDWIGVRDKNLSAMPETFGDDDPHANDLADLQRSEVFDDPDLKTLVDLAVTNNQELQIVRQDITVSNAEIIARRGRMFPYVDAGLGAGVEKVGRYTSQGAADASSFMTPGHHVPENLGDFSIGLHAWWEIDIWGKLKNATQAARARYASSVEGRNFLVTGVVAEVASDYYELVALDRQLEVLESNIQLLRQGLDMVKLQQQAARSTMLGVQRFTAELQRNESRRYDLLQRVVETENHLNFLCGRYPQSIPRNASRFDSTGLAPLTAGLPAQLLVRRPDIRQAERELEAAKLDVKVARKQFFPSLTIDAAFGISAFNPVKWATLPASLLYRIAADLLGPLINRTEIKSEWYASNARQMQAVVGYERTVLLAFVDVANQIAAIGNADRGYELKAQQVDTLRQAIDTSNLLFRSARADYLEVLTTRREALEAEMELVDMRQQQLMARIDLYRALGGGWPGGEMPADQYVIPKRSRGGW